MFRLWCRTFKDNHMLKDIVIERPESELTRTKKVFSSLEEACEKLELPVPVWLDSSIRDFKKFSRTRFYQDSFMREVPFEYLEIRVIEE